MTRAELQAKIEALELLIGRMKNGADRGLPINGETWEAVAQVDVAFLRAQLAALPESEQQKLTPKPWPPPGNACDLIVYRPDAGWFQATLHYGDDGDPTWFSAGGVDDLTGQLPTHYLDTILDPEPEQPWTDRERELHRMLDMAWNGKRRHDEHCWFQANDQPKCTCGYEETEKEIQAALAEAPPSDPASVESALSAVRRDDAELAIERMHGAVKDDQRNEALKVAEKALEGCARLIKAEWFIDDCPTNESPRMEYESTTDALAAIAHAKGVRS